MIGSIDKIILERRQFKLETINLVRSPLVSHTFLFYTSTVAIAVQTIKPEKRKQCPLKNKDSVCSSFWFISLLQIMDVDDEDLYGPDAFETPTVTTTKEPNKHKEMVKEQNEEDDMEDVYEDDDLVRHLIPFFCRKSSLVLLIINLVNNKHPEW